MADRFCEIIDASTPEARRFKFLEDISGIQSVSWRKAYLRGQRPTIEMIETVAQQWPQYAFWLSTGITDPLRGHIAPKTTASAVPVLKGKKQIYAEEVFKKQIELLKAEAKIGDRSEAQRVREEIGNAIRSDSLTPSLCISFEAIMSLYGEDSRYDYFEYITNEELQRLQKMRDTEEIDMLQTISNHQKNIVYSAFIDKLLKKLRSLSK